MPLFLLGICLLTVIYVPTDGAVVKKKIMTCKDGWGYGSTDGPAKWGSFCPACDGKRQSPITIQPDTVTLAKLAPIKFNRYDAALKELPIMDTGHSEQVVIPHDFNISIEIPTKPGMVYDLAQIHFHWGQKNQTNTGSEHSIGDKFFPFEMHLVHKVNSSNIAVLGVFGEVHCDEENVALSTISSSMNGTINPKDISKLNTEVKIRDLLPKDTSTFFTYSGSLTTPNCAEVVEWFVFEKPILVSQITLNKLRHVIDNNNASIVENHRPPQALNGRTVFYSGATRPVQPKVLTEPLKCKKD